MSGVNQNDKLSNWFRWLAFGSMGLYLWRINKVKAKEIGSENPNNLEINIDTDKMIDAATNFIPGAEHRKTIFNVFTKEFINGYKKRRNNDG